MAVTVDQVRAQIAAGLHLADISALQPFWVPIATQALAQAQTDVQGVLVRRGFTLTQMGLWAGFDAAVLSQAMFWSWTMGGAPGAMGEERQDVSALDQRKGLLEATLYDSAGNRIVPGLDVPGVVNQPIGRGDVHGGWNDVKAKDPNRKLGFTDPSTGRFMNW